MSTSVCFLVDGFNLYHSIRETRGKTGADCRWLDIRSLCESMLYLIDPSARTAHVHCFSALARHREKTRPGTVSRHTRYLDAIGATGVVTHLGVFKPKDVHYRSPTCDVRLRRHEEKETRHRSRAGVRGGASDPTQPEAVLPLSSVPLE
jgi:hypothetical protein